MSIRKRTILTLRYPRRFYENRILFPVLVGLAAGGERTIRSVSLPMLW